MLCQLSIQNDTTSILLLKFCLKIQETKIGDFSLFQYFASDPYPDVVMWTML